MAWITLQYDGQLVPLTWPGHLYFRLISHLRLRDKQHVICMPIKTRIYIYFGSYRGDIILMVVPG